MNMGMKTHASTSFNPQGNSVLERIHQVFGNNLRAFNLNEVDLHPEDPWEEFITATAYALRATYNTTLKATPAQLVFGRDMILPISYEADWDAITARKQRKIDENCARENRKRLRHEYKLGDQVTLDIKRLIPKLQIPKEGPFDVVQTHDNGTVTIKRAPYTEDRVNIRRCNPYYQRD